MAVTTVMVKDAGGTTVVKSMDARIKKPVDLDRGKDVVGHEWVIQCGHLDMMVGGNLGSTFDPLLYAMTVGSIVITGLADGTFFKAKRNVDSNTMYVGTDGDVAWARQHNKSGEVSFVLKSTSPCNDLLSEFLATDEIRSPV